MIEVSRARTSDVEGIRRLVEPQAGRRVLLAKETVAYYESVPEFRVVRDEAGEVVGCGALHVMWRDLAEVRTLTVRTSARSRHMTCRAPQPTTSPASSRTTRNSGTLS